jgi:formylglycine-generating enzyme required for sulfatase activity/serine/threonine protein kinase
VIATTNDLLEFLQSQCLLSAEQLAVLARETPPADARAAARLLVQRDWLTPYQVNELFLGRGERLVLGSYVLLELLGEGGMGQVFKARNWKLGQVVAVKLIRKDRLTNPSAIKRFYREIRAAATLEHPNIVRAFDADEVDGTHFFVMEFVEGTDLNKLVKTQGVLDVRQACGYVCQAALGLQHAYERGLVHRDIKPHNLLMVSGGNVTHQIKILDMGLARIVSDTDGDHSSTMTQEGAIMGTPDFIAPEQSIDSHQVDIRADLYSLGCTLYFLLSGRVPFPGGEMMDKLLRHQNEDAKSLESVRPEVSHKVSAIVHKLMAKRPEHRFQTPGELASALEGIKQHTSGIRHPDRTLSPTTGTMIDPKLARQWAAAVAPSSDTAALVKPPIQFAPASKQPLFRRWLAVGGGAALVLLILIIWQPWRRGGEQPNPYANLPSKHKPSREELARQEVKERQQLAEQAEQKRSADAQDALKPLVTRVALLGAGASPAGDALRKELREFLMKHSATPAATNACKLLNKVLVKLPSPLDQLDGAEIPGDAKAAWTAMGKKASPQLVAVLGGPFVQDNPIYSLDISPTGEYVAAGYRNEADVRIWNGRNGVEFRRLKGPSPGVHGMVFTPDGRNVLSGHYDKIIRIWDLNSGKEKQRFQMTETVVLALAVPPDGARVLSTHHDPTICLWDMNTGQTVRRFSSGHFDWVHQLTISPDGRFALSGGHQDRTVCYWDLENEQPLFQFEAKLGKSVTGLAFSRDGRLGFWGTLGDSFYLWEVNSKKEPTAIQLPKAEQINGCFTLDGKKLLLTGSADELQLWDLAAQKVTERWGLPGKHTRLRLAPDGRHLAVGTMHGVVYILRLADGLPRPLGAMEAKQQQENEAKRLSVPVQITNSIGMKLNLIPAGRFLMGSPEDEPGRQADESPRHEVTITKPFYLGIHEVTQKQFAEVMGKNPSTFNKANGGGSEHPVETVSWEDAVAFCKTLSDLPREKKAGRIYRLPTEAEWEYGCRAGAQTAYHFGNDLKLFADFDWSAIDVGVYRTHPVGLLKPNAWGLFDMHGNVMEWSGDYYAPTYYQEAPQTDPRGPKVGNAHTLRGGPHLGYGEVRCRAAYRWPNSGGRLNVGFRVVCHR